MLRKIIIAFVVLFPVCLTFSARQIKLPEPDGDYYIYDYAEIISEEKEKYINEFGKRFETNSGIDFIVVSVYHTGYSFVEDYLKALSEKFRPDGNCIIIMPATVTGGIYGYVSESVQKYISQEKLDSIIDDYTHINYERKIAFEISVHNIYNAVLREFGETGIIAPETDVERMFKIGLRYILPVIAILSLLVYLSKKKYE